MKRRMQRANKLNARAAVILGDDELAKGVAQLKDLDIGEQREVALDALVESLTPLPRRERRGEGLRSSIPLS
jgi:histidyl-tRNA synthetase